MVTSLKCAVLRDCKINITCLYRAKQDIIDSFTSKYLPEVSPGDVQVLQQAGDVYISYPPSIEEALQSYEMDPITAAQKFVVDGVATAVSPLDAPVNSEKVKKDPRRFFKPVQLSKLRQTLERDPYYFKK